MKNVRIGLAAIASISIACSAIVRAQQEPTAAPSPNEIVARADPGEWVAMAPDDLLVMTLAPADDGAPREVVIQLIAPPFSQGWVENIRALARAGWYDGITVNRVQDNYVVQWGDPNYDNPEAEGEAKPLPEGLRVMEEDGYTQLWSDMPSVFRQAEDLVQTRGEELHRAFNGGTPSRADAYADATTIADGWPTALEGGQVWPVHCYGMVGVGRGMSPDTGSGAELYTVIGHAPRHLDRNIALVGRVISGMEHLSSLPRGSGALGFYTADEFDKRTPIRSIRVASDLPASQRPQFEYLSTEGETFAHYVEARANRRDPFFIVPAGGADICNIPVPIRAIEAE